MRDAAEVAALTDGDEEEGDEADYAEVVEYLRAGTLLTRTECCSRSAPDGGRDGEDANDPYDPDPDDPDEVVG